MIVNYTLKPSELTPDFVEHLKQMYKDNTINISIIDTEQTPHDETEFLLRNPTHRAYLLNAIDDAKNGKDMVDVDITVIQKDANSFQR